jgi:hypothetical protein
MSCPWANGLHFVTLSLCHMIACLVTLAGPTLLFVALIAIDNHTDILNRYAGVATASGAVTMSCGRTSAGLLKACNGLTASQSPAPALIRDQKRTADAPSLLHRRGQKCQKTDGTRRERATCQAERRPEQSPGKRLQLEPLSRLVCCPGQALSRDCTD